MTAEIRLADHFEGPEHTVVVRHGCPDAKARNEVPGFFERSGSVTAALTAHAESETV